MAADRGRRLRAADLSADVGGCCARWTPRSRRRPSWRAPSPLRAFGASRLRMAAIPRSARSRSLFFVRAFESFEVPALVGLAGNINVLTTTIYPEPCTAPACRAMAKPAPIRSASSSSSPLLLIWQNRLSRHAHKYQTITGKGFRPRIDRSARVASSQRRDPDHPVSHRHDHSGGDADLHVVAAVLRRHQLRRAEPRFAGQLSCAARPGLVSAIRSSTRSSSARRPRPS